MAKIRLKQVEGIGRIQVSHAFTAFIRHCQLKNLALYSIRYYQDNLGFFFELMPKIKYVDEISQDSINEFIGILMDNAIGLQSGSYEPDCGHICSFVYN